MKVLVCTDFSSAAAAGEREAANRFPDAELILFHAIDEELVRLMGERTGQDGETLREEMTHYADLRMEEIVQRLRSLGRRASGEIGSGVPAEAALAAAARLGAQLIVCGVMPGVAVGRFRVGLARGTRVPVLLVPG